MATDWANILEWGGAKEFRLPTAFELARGSIPDSAKGAENDFRPDAQNAALLQALGYGGNPLNGDAWSDSARTWLHDNGYQLGVGHQPGTKAQGRAEYFGLIGPDGKFVQGQSDPTVMQSDSWGDIVAPFALMAAPFAAQAMFGQAAGAGAGGLSAAADGVTALGSAWSPQALGLTSLAPSTAAAEIAALSGSLPTIGGAAGLGAIGGLGGGAEGVAALGSSWSPSALGLTEAIAPAASAGELAAIGSGIPGAVSIPGAAAAIDPYDSKFYRPGGPSELGNMGGASGGAATLPTAGGSGFLDSIGLGSVGSAIDKVSSVVGGGSNLAGLIGGAIGATQGGKAEVSSRDPWLAAQPYLKNLLGDADSMRAKFAAEPYTPQQTQQYQQAFAGLDQARSALPGLLNWGQSAMQRQSTVPSYQQLFGGGLLPQQQPTAQAGGAGGLLGGSQDDRIKALMTAGRGLIG
jgi:hypothetical protein